MATAISRRLAGTAAAAAALAGAMLVSPTQAHAAWGAQQPFTEVANVYGGGSSFQVGEIHGWVQFDSGGQDARYSLDVCRQSAYVLYVTVAYNETTQNPSTGAWSGGTVVNSGTPPWHSATSPCWNSEATMTGTVHASNLTNFYVSLTGGTFVNGQSLVTDDDYYLLHNPY
jgi:hypothetical protein